MMFFKTVSPGSRRPGKICLIRAKRILTNGLHRVNEGLVDAAHQQR